jgi:hypothetical protein
MSSKKPESTDPTVEVKTVRVKTIRYHTIDAVQHGVGDEYDVEAAAVENLIASGFVVRVVEVTPGDAPPAAEPKTKT